MSTRIYRSTGGRVQVTEFCGPADTESHTRKMLQVDDQSQYVTLDYAEVQGLVSVFTRWLKDNAP